MAGMKRILFEMLTMELPRLDGALCRDHPYYEPDDWFADQEEDPDTVAAVKEVCDGCPVKMECRRFAAENDERFGVWGGEYLEWHISRRLHDNFFAEHGGEKNVRKR